MMGLLLTRVLSSLLIYDTTSMFMRAPILRNSQPEPMLSGDSDRLGSLRLLLFLVPASRLTTADQMKDRDLALSAFTELANVTCRVDTHWAVASGPLVSLEGPSGLIIHTLRPL